MTEDYVVFRVNRLADAAGARLPADALRDEDIAPAAGGRVAAALGRHPARPALAALLVLRGRPRGAHLERGAGGRAGRRGHRRPVRARVRQRAAARAALRRRACSTPRSPRSTRAWPRRGAASTCWWRGFSRVLADLQTRVADVTELVERVENSLKVTDDVFLARIYAAALEIFRGAHLAARHRPQAGDPARQLPACSNAESQARRAEMLEIDHRPADRLRDRAQPDPLLTRDGRGVAPAAAAHSRPRHSLQPPPNPTPSKL